MASLNLHAGADASGRPFDVTSALCQFDAAVICVQENRARNLTPGHDAAGTDTAGTGSTDAQPADDVRRAADKLGMTLHRVDMRTLRDHGSLCIAVLTALPVTGYQVIQLGHGPGDNVPRAAQVLRLQTAGGATVRLVNTHLTHSLASPVQLWRLWAHLRAAGRVPTVIVGDLNMPGVVASHFPGLTSLVSGRTFPAAAPVVQLDHILVSRGIRGGRGAVLPDAGSDHLPVRAHFGVEAPARLVG